MGVVFSSSSYFCCSSKQPTSIRGGSGKPILEKEESAMGHTFYYVPSATSARQSPQPPPAGEQQQQQQQLLQRHSFPPFKVISGASLSANATSSGCVLESSSSFSAFPLRLSSGDSERRGLSLSAPIERGAGFRGGVPLGAAGRMKKQRSGGKSGSGRSYHLRRSLSEESRLPSVVPMRYVGNKRKFERDMMVGGGGGAGGGSMQWACGKAGEDRVHVVVSEEHRWLFVGIYDGFNGADAPEFLVRNLYRAVFDQLKGLLSEGGQLEPRHGAVVVENNDGMKRVGSRNWRLFKEFHAINVDVAKPHDTRENGDVVADQVSTVGRSHEGTRKPCSVEDHDLVLGTLSRAMEITEHEYLELTDAAMNHNPELALMGSCVLAVLVIDEDVYVLNLGDSRAIVGQYKLPDEIKERNSDSEVDVIEGIVEQVNEGMEEEGAESTDLAPSMELGALQLSIEHSTSNHEEVQRIKEEHPDDARCIINEKIKGRLKVTRAFGVGYLKQPKWNNGLLKMFRNEYIGTRPYVSSSPSLFHHRLGSNDRFLVLSSDGLYQYLTNEEVVSHVVSFMEKFPGGDPAQSLIQELLLRAAKNAGMNLHALLEIPHGERRKFHDDVVVMVVSVEGRIWKSSG